MDPLINGILQVLSVCESFGEKKTLDLSYFLQSGIILHHAFSCFCKNKLASA